jgi:hypothetical protein
MSRNMNGFSVEIPECIEEDCNGYITMKHGANFTIKLNNHHKYGGHGKPCDADVYVDGKNVGTFRLTYGETIRLEHPVYDNGRFTAYKRGTIEACQAGINANSDDAGLIKVIFRPGEVSYSCCWVKTEYDWPNAFDINYRSTGIDPNEHDPVNINSNHYYDGGYATNNSTFSCNAEKSIISTSRAYNCSVPSSKLVSGGVGLSGHSDQNFNSVDSLNYDEPPTTISIRLAFRECDCEPRPLYTRVYSTSVPRPLR